MDFKKNVVVMWYKLNLLGNKKAELFLLVEIADSILRPLTWQKN